MRQVDENVKLAFKVRVWRLLMQLRLTRGMTFHNKTPAFVPLSAASSASEPPTHANRLPLKGKWLETLLGTISVRGFHIAACWNFFLFLNKTFTLLLKTFLKDTFFLMYSLPPLSSRNGSLLGWRKLAASLMLTYNGKCNWWANGNYHKSYSHVILLFCLFFLP